MTRFVIAVLAALGLASVAAQAADPPSQAARPAMKAVSTEMFLTKAAGGNMFEIESSKLAVSRTKSEPIRDFANKMVADHGTAAKKFKAAVAEAKLEAPPEVMDAKHKAIVDDLRSQEGAAFDQAYVEAQRKAHIETVELFEAYADKGDNARMKQFAKDMLPTLKTHLEHVTKLRNNKA